MKTLVLILSLFGALTASAASRIQATLTVTNGTTNGLTLVVNADTRTFTNVFSATEILTNSTIGGTATNVYNALATNGVAGPVIPTQTGTNIITLLGWINQAMTVSATGWGDIAYSTQAVGTANAIRVPMSVEAATNATNFASQLVSDLSTYSTNAFGTNSVALSNFVALITDQTISGNKTFTGTNTFTNSTWNAGTISNATISAGTLTNNTITNPTINGGIRWGGTNDGTHSRAVTITNSTWLAGQFTNSADNTFRGTNYIGRGVVTNLYAASFTNRSGVITNLSVVGALYPYSNDCSQVQIGTNAFASNLYSIAIGISTIANSQSAVAIGDQANATANNGIAIGTLAAATGLHSTAMAKSAAASGQYSFALGRESIASAGYSFAIGNGARAIHTNTIAIGVSIESTDTNQVRVGDSSYIASFPGRAAFSNSISIGTAERETLPTSLVGGAFFKNGTSASADPTNGFVMNAASGEWIYRASASSEGAGQNNRVHNRGAEVVGSGTDYTLTASTALVDFGGTDPDINTLPSAGTYLITAIVTATAGASASDTYVFKLYDATAAADIANSSQSISTPPASQKFQVVIQTVKAFTVASRIQLYGHNNTAARGTVNSTETKLVYVRLF